MIPSLINKLILEHKIIDAKSLDDISFSLISSGNYRSRKMGRFVVILFNNSKPIFVLKFYKINNEKISKEFKLEDNFYKTFPALTPKSQFLQNINGHDILLEKHIPGQNFNRYFYEHHDELSIKNSIKLVFDFYEKLNLNLESSSFQTLNDEITSLYQQFSNIYDLEKNEIEFIEECKKIFLDYFQNKSIFVRLSNNDFISRNFIKNENKLTLVDFEFSSKTALYFLEWFQFFKYQWSVSNDFLHDLLINDYNDPFFKSALTEFSKYQDNEKFNISNRVIFEIFEFVKQYDVFSIGSQQILKNEFSVLLNKLNSRFKDNLPSEIPSGILKSKNKFFDLTYEKLTDYKNTYELNFLKNAVNDQKDMINGLEKSLSETNSYLENVIKEKDAHFERVIKEKDAHFEHVIKDKNDLISGLENSIQKLTEHVDNINKSKIWKFLQFFVRHDKN